jgi:hypothetical protein
VYVGARLAINNVYGNQPVGTCTENNVSEWKSPYIGRDGALGSAINRGSVPFTGDLPDLAKRFVFEHLGMNLNDPELKDTPTLAKKAVMYKIPGSPMTKPVEWIK